MNVVYRVSLRQPFALVAQFLNEAAVGIAVDDARVPAWHSELYTGVAVLECHLVGVSATGTNLSQPVCAHVLVPFRVNPAP